MHLPPMRACMHAPKNTQDALDRSGALRKLQALARAEALRALSPRPGGGGGTLQPPEPACETLLINELIRGANRGRALGATAQRRRWRRRRCAWGTKRAAAALRSRWLLRHPGMQHAPPLHAHQRQHNTATTTNTNTFI